MTEALPPFAPLTENEKEVLRIISAEYGKIYSTELCGLPGVRNGGLPAVARYIARRMEE